MRLAALLALLVVSAVACQAEKTRCEKACRVEADCAEEREVAEVDVSECIETCRELERRADTRPIVEAHVTCVEQATGCAAILDCP